MLEEEKVAKFQIKSTRIFKKLENSVEIFENVLSDFVEIFCFEEDFDKFSPKGYYEIERNA